MSQSLTLTLFLILAFLVALPAEAQQVEEEYELRFRPDLWYNSTDGVRLGTRMEGRVAGTGEGGAHRLDLGAWIGMWFPSLPVSYHLTYTEPVSALSEPESEFHVRLLTTVREGYQEHGLTVRKRWQRGGDHRHYWETGTSFHMENMFNDRYRLFPELWDDEWFGWLRGFVEHQHLNRAGLFRMDVTAGASLLDETALTSRVRLLQQIRIYGDWQLRLRLFAEQSDRSLPGQYQLLLSSGNQISQLNHPFTRSRGTIPPRWVQSGQLHLASGPNLRGYTDSDIRSVRQGEPNFHERIAAFNTELDIPNPIQQGINHVDVLREFLAFRSYLFGGAATTDGSVENDADSVFMEAGAGLAISFNIPDHLGRDRGFALRYEVPFWLSEPESGDQWSWRHLVGIGAVISF